RCSCAPSCTTCTRSARTGSSMETRMCLPRARTTRQARRLRNKRLIRRRLFRLNTRALATGTSRRRDHAPPTEPTRHLTRVTNPNKPCLWFSPIRAMCRRHFHPRMVPLTQPTSATRSSLKPTPMSLLSTPALVSRPSIQTTMAVGVEP
ncbi:hypothetical protein H4R26_005984, partial [Coemansia thaxteri]